MPLEGRDHRFLGVSKKTFSNPKLTRFPWQFQLSRWAKTPGSPLDLFFHSARQGILSAPPSNVTC